MASHRHKIKKVNKASGIVSCENCGEVNGYLKSRNGKDGLWVCSVARKEQHGKRKPKPSNYKYRHWVKDSCESCGFVPVDICQLDVDHIDGNHSNNEVSNLQTLCANCHRLKTKLQKDGMYNR